MSDFEREAFERAFPVPDGVEFNEAFEAYQASVYSEPSVSKYNLQWKTWKAARAQGDGEAEPVITSEMKVECMGEFSWKEEAPYYNEDGDVIDYVATHVVPWDICKDIYKRMAKLDPSRVAHPPAAKVPEFKTARDFFESGDFLLAQDLDACEQQAEGWNKFRQTLLSATPQPEAGSGQWVRSKPDKPGRYAVRGFDDANTEALVAVALDDDDLVCNLHDSNSDPVRKYSSLLSEISDKFEWLGLSPQPTQENPND